MNLAAIPIWLRLWLAFQVLASVLGPLFRPQGGTPTRSLVWGIVMMLIGWAMWERSKAAWIGALLLAVWAVYASVMTLFVWNPNLGPIQPVGWFVLGVATGPVALALLLSPSARRWVNGSSVNPPTYAGKESSPV